ncbi:hypothetical protein ACLKA7_007664 [Drosophila subpalustris]
MVGVSWVYFRRRDQLIAIATDFGLDTEGTVVNLRARVAEFVLISTHAEQVNQRLVEREHQYRDASGSGHSDSKSRSRSVSPVPRDRVVPQVIVTAPGSQPPRLERAIVSSEGIATIPLPRRTRAAQIRHIAR